MECSYVCMYVCACEHTYLRTSICVCFCVGCCVCAHSCLFCVSTNAHVPSGPSNADHDSVLMSRTTSTST